MVVLVMSKINPLFILGFTFLLFIYSIINLSFAKTSLYDMKLDFKQYNLISNRYYNLKNKWNKNKNIKDKIKNILKLSNIKEYNINTTNKTIKIKINNSNVKVLGTFMNKILNETFVISKFTFTQTSLDLEVGR